MCGLTAHPAAFTPAEALPLQSKARIAAEILNRVERLLTARSAKV